MNIHLHDTSHNAILIVKMTSRNTKLLFFNLHADTIHVEGGGRNNIYKKRRKHWKEKKINPYLDFENSTTSDSHCDASNTIL